jgi:hypothetical protein
MTRKTNAVVQVAAVVVAALVLGTTMVGCGGRQTPPATGQCHPWREWVPPARDENGQMRDGYCRGERT